MQTPDVAIRAGCRGGGGLNRALKVDCTKFHEKWVDFLSPLYFFMPCSAEDSPGDTYNEGWLSISDRGGVACALRHFDVDYFFYENRDDGMHLLARIPKENQDIVEFTLFITDPKHPEWPLLRDGKPETPAGRRTSHEKYKDEFRLQLERWPRAPGFLELYTCPVSGSVWRFARAKVEIPSPSANSGPLITPMPIRGRVSAAYPTSAISNSADCADIAVTCGGSICGVCGGTVFANKSLYEFAGTASIDTAPSESSDTTSDTTSDTESCGSTSNNAFHMARTVVADVLIGVDNGGTVWIPNASGKMWPAGPLHLELLKDPSPEIVEICRLMQLQVSEDSE